MLELAIWVGGTKRLGTKRLGYQMSGSLIIMLLFVKFTATVEKGTEARLPLSL